MSRSDGIVEKALKSLGKGLDITCDFRLKFCKGGDGERLVVLNDAVTRDLDVPGFGTFKGVPVDIKCDKGDRTRYQSDVLDFNQMSEFFNQKCAVGGKIPSGEFNAAFGFDGGAWAYDAANTKSLAIDGYFITLFNLRIHRSPLVLSDEVRNAVPSSWDPRALARFIETYGTHIIVGLSIGGQDLVLVRQDRSSNLEPSELKKHFEELGDQLFSGTCPYAPHLFKSKEQKPKAPRAFNIFDSQTMALNSFSSVTAKDGISVICSKKGGDAMANSHCEWLLTVPLMPDAIHFNFIPITSLLKHTLGEGFLSHAINLYLRYKPPIADLQYFLEFQTHKMWAPIHGDLPLGPLTVRANAPTPFLQFNLMGPKLYVNTNQVIAGNRPLTGMRLFLEGLKCNRLAIHVQHLSNTPMMLQNKIDDHTLWRKTDEISDDRYFEPVHGKKFSHICAAPVKYDPDWAAGRTDVSFIVTGAQLYVKKHGPKAVLHLRLLYSKASDFCIVNSQWTQACLSKSQQSGFFSTSSTSSSGSLDKEKQPVVVVDSAVFPTGPPVPVQTQKLLKFVDTTQLCRGPQDSPGHWLVTGAKLDSQKGKICLHVKFSLLSITTL